jgi:hypothetical protein
VHDDFLVDAQHPVAHVAQSPRHVGHAEGRRHADRVFHTLEVRGDAQRVLVAVELHASHEHHLAPLRRAARQLDPLGREEDLREALALEHLRVQRAVAPRVAGLGAARVDLDDAVRASGRRVEVQGATREAQRSVDAVQRRAELEMDLRLLGHELQRAALAADTSRRREARRQRQCGGDSARARAQRQSASRSGMKSQSNR